MRTRVYVFPDHAEVWLEVRTRFDGMCIGAGTNSSEARIAATMYLTSALESVLVVPDQEVSLETIGPAE